MSNFRVSTKLLVIVAVEVSIVFGASFLAHKKLELLEHNDAWFVHTYRVIDTVWQMLLGLVDQETGLRGYLLSGDERFLEPFWTGKETYSKAYARAKELTSHNRDQQMRLNDLKSIEQAWREQRAEPAITLMSNPRTRQHAEDMETTGIGKNLMDDMREVLATMINTERMLLTSRSTQERQALQQTYVFLVGACMAVMIGASLTAYLFVFEFARKLGEMTDSMRRLASGDPDIEVVGTDRQDEIGDVARALDGLKECAVARKRAEVAQTSALV